tara:strand:- start:701 stop:1615 length:915 start_codon:yes stop_codon:yes gene_type:complete
MIKEDQLSWDQFNKNSNLSLINLPIKSEPFNRLILHTNNFFVIAGYGAFNPGYVMLVSKKLIPSFANINREKLDEFTWLKNFLDKILTEVFDDTSNLIFEHGMCACLGGLDRAHLHFLSCKNINKKNLLNAINLSLSRRRTGIKSCTFEGIKYNNIEDIDSLIFNIDDENKIAFEGYQYKFEDIKTDYKTEEYPLNLKPLIKTGNPYIFFESKINEYSFITLEHIDTQFGREVSFNVQYYDNEQIKIFMKENNIELNKDYKFFWRWQDFYFEKNILETIKKLAIHINKNYKKDYFNEYNLRSFD